MLLRPIVSAALVALLIPTQAWAADRPSVTATARPQQLFWPTVPDGVADDLPRSPLSDLIVNQDVRFSDPVQAQARCPTDVVVWVELFSNRYRAVRTAHADGWPGAFMCQGDASIEGDLP